MEEKQTRYYVIYRGIINIDKDGDYEKVFDLDLWLSNE